MLMSCICTCGKSDRIEILVTERDLVSPVHRVMYTALACILMHLETCDNSSSIETNLYALKTRAHTRIYIMYWVFLVAWRGLKVVRQRGSERPDTPVAI